MSLERLQHLHQRLVQRICQGPRLETKPWGLDSTLGRELLQSMLLARHIDTVAHVLHDGGAGLYTIASTGHEANAVLGRLTHSTDPALLHYRSAALYLERARQVEGFDAVHALCASLVGARSDPASGGRHKVFGHPDLGIIPQTSTIASHLPRAVGIAFALELRSALGSRGPQLHSSIAVASFGDASINHSTWLGAVNAAGWASRRGQTLPLLLVCEDNGLGISVRSPPGWVEARLRTLPHVRYWHAPAGDIEATYRAGAEAIAWCRERRAPAVFHLECVRLLGHWGHDHDETYRRPEEIRGVQELDPLPRMALALMASGVASAQEILDWDRDAQQRAERAAHACAMEPTLSSEQEVSAPLSLGSTESAERAAASRRSPPRPGL